MRSWLTTRDVQAMLGVGQSRVSRLVQAGAIVAERDAEGRLKYDRASVEQYAAHRAVQRAPDPALAEERRLAQVEARERFARARRLREREERERREALMALAQRAVDALERWAKCGK